MANFFAILKGTIEAVKIIGSLYEWWKDRELRKVEKAMESKNSAQHRLNEKIEKEVSKEKPDEEVIKDLHRRLNNIAKQL